MFSPSSGHLVSRVFRALLRILVGLSRTSFNTFADVLCYSLVWFAARLHVLSRRFVALVLPSPTPLLHRTHIGTLGRISFRPLVISFMNLD